MPRSTPSLDTLGTLLVTSLLLSCGGGEGGSGPDPGDEINSVTIQPTTASIEVGEQQQFTATVRDRDGDVVNASVNWSSNNTGVATVDQTGLATGVGAGTAEIIAVVSSATDVQNQAALTVEEPTPPAAASNVQSSAVSDTEIDVTWQDNSDDEDEFLVEREEVGGGGGPAAAAAFVEAGRANANETTFRDSGLDPNTTYRYRVSACNQAGCASPADGDAAGTTTHETLVLETDQLSDGVVDQAYQATLMASGGTGSFQWDVISGALPDGLSLSSDGVISGTPEAAGTFGFTVEVTSGGQTETRELSITVTDVLEITTTSLPDGQVDVEYDETVQVTGGDGNNTFSITDGALHPDLSLNQNTGAITGTPTSTGTFNFTVTVNSGDGQSDSQELSITVTSGPPNITTTSFPNGEVGVVYSSTAMAEGGDENFTWNIESGTLPDGLSLNMNTGEISGTPEVAGTFNFTLKVTSAGLMDTQAFSITIDATSVSLDTDYLFGGNTGVGYTDDLDASGGDGTTYTFTVIAGDLPTGLGIDNATGTITGTPGEAGVFYFTIEVESGGETDSKTYAVAISSNAPEAFNMWVMNVTDGGGIPSASVIQAIEDAVARWEAVITGDLADRAFGSNEFGPAFCSGDGEKMNGQSLDDMVVMLNLAPIDGPGMTLGSGGPCSGRVVAPAASPPAGGAAASSGHSINTTFGRLTLDTDDLGTFTAEEAFNVAFHEIGHIVGIGTWWRSLDGVGGMNLISGAGTADPRYEGDGGNTVFTDDYGGGSASASKIPIEADGGEGTRDGHWDEGEFDNEIMTGFAEATGVDQPLSKMSIAAVGDLAYTVDTSADDPYSIPLCAPACPASPPAGGPGAEPIDLRNDIWRGRVALFFPDGRVIFVDPPTLR